MTQPPDTAAATRFSMRRVLFALGIMLLAFLSLGAWAVASPVGSSPDEDFHLASIWCGAGEREGLCGQGSSPDHRAIPNSIEDSICYAHDNEQSAACQGDTFFQAGFELIDSKRVNTGGQYPSGYYFWTSWFASDNLTVSVLVIRVLQAALFTGLVALLWKLLPRQNRPALIGGIALTFVPLGMFLIPSVNPSGWAIASGALLLPSLVGYLTTEGRQRLLLGAFAVLAALLGLGARGDSAAYTVVAVLAALVLTFQMTLSFALRAILPTAIIIASAVVFLSAGQTGLALDGMTQDGFESYSTTKLMLENFLALPELFAGVLGQNFDGTEYTGLGWLDTPLPAAVWGLTTFVFAGVVFAALRRLSTRRAVALIGVAAATFIIPFTILVQSHVLVGNQVQPRYIMPLVTMFVIVALSPSFKQGAGFDAAQLTRLTTVQLWIVAALLSIANAVALFIHMRRYISPGNFNLNDADWWWQVGPPPMLVLFIGAASFAAFAAMAVRLIQQNRARMEVAV